MLGEILNYQYNVFCDRLEVICRQYSADGTDLEDYSLIKDWAAKIFPIKSLVRVFNVYVFSEL